MKDLLTKREWWQPKQNKGNVLGFQSYTKESEKWNSEINSLVQIPKFPHIVVNFSIWTVCARQQIFIEQLPCVSQEGYGDVMAADKKLVAAKQLGDDNTTWQGKGRDLWKHKGIPTPVLGQKRLPRSKNLSWDQKNERKPDNNNNIYIMHKCHVLF